MTKAQEIIIAYSYLRFSKPKQELGNSKQRQNEAFDKYVADNNLTVSDYNFEDLGVSAFRSRNASEDKGLGQFLLGLESGAIETPCYFLIEAMDRLSRDDVDTADTQFKRILNHGVTVVDIRRGKEYRKGMDLLSRITALLDMDRAHEESKHKSERVLKARNDRLAEVNPKKWKSCPFWLELSKDGTQYLERTEFISVIHEVFAMAASGLSAAFIARELNSRHIKTVKGNKWYPSSIQQLLTNRALIGEYQPYRRTEVEGKRVDTPIGKPLLNYYPVILGSDYFHVIQAGLKVRTKQRVKGRSESQLHLLKGLGTCSCGSRLTLKKQPKAHYLQCVSVCGQRPINLKYLHTWLIDVWLTPTYSIVSVDSVPEARQLIPLEQRLDELKASEARLTPLYSQFGSEETLQELTAVLTEAKQVKAQIEALKEELSPYSVTQAAIKERSDLVSTAFTNNNDTPTLAARGRLAQLLQQLKSFQVHTDHDGRVSFGIVDAKNVTRTYTAIPKPFHAHTKHVGSIWSE